MDDDTRIEFKNINNTLCRIEKKFEKVWDRLNENTKGISHIKGWIAGAVVCCGIIIGCIKYL